MSKGKYCQKANIVKGHWANNVNTSFQRAIFEVAQVKGNCCQRANICKGQFLSCKCKKHVVKGQEVSNFQFTNKYMGKILPQPMIMYVQDHFNAKKVPLVLKQNNWVKIDGTLLVATRRTL